MLKACVISLKLSKNKYNFILINVMYIIKCMCSVDCGYIVNTPEL